MKTIFSIGDEQASGALLLELGQDHCCYAVLDTGAKAVSHIRYIGFDTEDAAAEQAAVIEELARRNWQRTVVCVASETALLVPQTFVNASETLHKALYDHRDDVLLQDQLPEWQLSVAYMLSRPLHTQLASGFGQTSFLHAYTPSLKNYNGFPAPDQIDLQFSTRHFRVVVKQDMQVRLVQTYTYKTPLDVVYYLLKICYEFGLDQSQAFLIVSGPVEQDSALYQELHHYFLNLHLAQEPALRLPETELPHYYFTSLYNLAACAS